MSGGVFSNESASLPSIDEILEIVSPTQFNALVMRIFYYQSKHCKPYRDYLQLIGADPSRIHSPEQIPFLPIELFKSHRVYCGNTEPEIVFTSSNTGGMSASCHYMASKEVYEKSFRSAFTLFYGAPEKVSIYGLLPNYLQREGSSLIYMVDHLIRSGGGGFYLDDYPRLIQDMEQDPRPKILLGVSYALWDLAEQYAPKLQNTIVMETGGMKGHREELPKEEFHALLQKAFGVETIHSEYGMAELTSQAYSTGKGLFFAPPWMRIIVRDLNDPFDYLPPEHRGGINIIDLANLSSCAFIQTQDVGVVRSDGGFSILGRADRSEIRGCNLLVQ